MVFQNKYGENAVQFYIQYRKNYYFVHEIEREKTGKYLQFYSSEKKLFYLFNKSKLSRFMNAIKASCLRYARYKSLLIKSCVVMDKAKSTRKYVLEKAC